MNISARVDNSFGKHHVTLCTNDATRELSIAPRAEGLGSSANGGELLCLALATCYCNDVYREARKRGIELRRVEVDVHATFAAEGAGAERISYRARITGNAPAEILTELMRHTDTVAEIQNTVRSACPVHLTATEAESKA